MQRFLILAILLLSSACASTAFVAAGPTDLENSDKLDSSSNFSVQAGTLTAPDENSGMQGEAVIAYNKGKFTTSGVSGDTNEVGMRLGIRYTWNREGFLRPYLGAGLAPEYLKVSDSIGEHEHSFSLGGYAKAGIDMPIGKAMTIGLGYEHTFGDKHDLGSAKDQDFSAGSILLGIGFSL